MQYSKCCCTRLTNCKCLPIRLFFYYYYPIRATTDGRDSTCHDRSPIKTRRAKSGTNVIHLSDGASNHQLKLGSLRVPLFASLRSFSVFNANVTRQLLQAFFDFDFSSIRMIWMVTNLIIAWLLTGSCSLSQADRVKSGLKRKGIFEPVLRKYALLISCRFA